MGSSGRRKSPSGPSPSSGTTWARTRGSSPTSTTRPSALCGATTRRSSPAPAPTRTSPSWTSAPAGSLTSQELQGGPRGGAGDERGGAAAQRGPDRVRSAGLEPEAAAAVLGQRLRLCGERGVGGLPDAPVRNVRRDPARAQARGPRRDVLLEPVLPHEGHLRLDVHRRPGPHHDRGLLLPLHARVPPPPRCGTSPPRP